MQLIASILLIVIGVGLGLFVDAGDMRIFGWVVAAVGVLGLVVRVLVARRIEGGDPRRPR
jgi:hypothetical protein